MKRTLSIAIYFPKNLINILYLSGIRKKCYLGTHSHVVVVEDVSRVKLVLIAQGEFKTL